MSATYALPLWNIPPLASQLLGFKRYHKNAVNHKKKQHQQVKRAYDPSTETIRWYEVATERIGHLTTQLLSEGCDAQKTAQQQSEWVTIYQRLAEDMELSEEVHFDKQTWKNLSLLSHQEHSKGKTIFDCLNKTQTKVGAAVLSALLATPTTNIPLLKKRQAFILNLIENPELKKTITAHIEACAYAEKDLITLYDPASSLYDPALSLMLYNFPFSNEKHTAYTIPLVQEALSKLEDSSDVFHLISSIGIPASILYGLCKYKGLSGLITYLQTQKGMVDASSSRLLTTFAFLVVTSYFFCPSIVQGLQEKYAFLSTIKQVLLSLTSFFEGMRFIIQLTCSSSFNEYSELFPPTLHSSPAEAQTAYKKLESLSHSYHRSFIRSPYLTQGSLLAARPLIQNALPALAQNIHLVGLLDAYNAVAESIIKLQKQHYPLCPVTYLDNHSSPEYQLDDFWHPLLPSSAFNTGKSIHLGGEYKQNHALLTGPNAGGKSTHLKAITISLIFAQTFGFAFAKECRVTPFSYINTYANIVDSITDKKSLFKAELARAHTLVKHLSHTDSTDFRFATIDELLTGTNPTEGCAAAYGIARYIGELPQCITILTTHYRPLTKLATHAPYLYQPWCVRVIRKKDGTLEYPYTLEQGINIQNIAFDILKQESYIPSLITEAEKVLHEYHMDT